MAPFGDRRVQKDPPNPYIDQMHTGRARTVRPVERPPANRADASDLLHTGAPGSPTSQAPGVQTPRYDRVPRRATLASTADEGPQTVLTISGPARPVSPPLDFGRYTASSSRGFEREALVSTINVRLLGPFEVHRDGVPVPLAPRPAVLLAVLALRLGHAVSFSALTRTRPPRAANPHMFGAQSRCERDLPERSACRWPGEARHRCADRPCPTGGRPSQLFDGEGRLGGSATGRPPCG